MDRNLSRAAAGSLLDGRYQLRRRLGSGGMATVWEARDERLARDVAVKVLSDVFAGDEEYVRRFEREGRIAAGLNHPNLVAIFDVGTSSERPYLVMELVRGESLASLNGPGARLDLERLARELLAALDHMHGAGIIHRDLKPANVLLDADGRARVTDFGIAKPLDATALTHTGNVVGTLRYMAPEVQRGARATEQSDLYSLGILLRTCGGESEPRLRSLIARLTAEDPSERPASAANALAALDGAPSNGSGRAATAATVALGVASDSQPTRVLGTSQRRRTLVPIGLAALAGLVVLLLVLLVGGGGSGSQTSTGSTQAQRRPATSRRTTPTTAPTTTPATTRAPAAPTPPGNPCAVFDTRSKELDSQRAAADHAATSPQAKNEVHRQFDARKKALQAQKQACQKRQK